MSEAASDDEDLEPAPFILMQAEETFDGPERVMCRAAYDLQVRATSHSASCGHPGYVPDDYLEHLDGLGIETTITPAELCAIGTWQRSGVGYCVLDWEAVEYALDWVRQRRGEDPEALAAERDHEASLGPHGRTDGGHSRLRGMRHPVSPRRARSPRTRTRRMGAVARHRAGQHRAPTRARPVVSAVQGRRNLQRLR